MIFHDLRPGTKEVAEEVRAAFERVMRSAWFIRGEEVEKFEAEWAAYCGTRHCVGVGNGMDALTIALRAAGIGQGDEVIVPANGYAADWMAVEAVGAVLVPVEPGAHGNMDPRAFGAAITARTQAVIALHLYGHPVDPEVLRIARARRLFVLEDAAHAHGAKLGNRRAGALGSAAAFSFYPTKNLGAFGDAGAITTSDRQLADRARRLANYGSSRKYVNDVVGVNSRLDEIQAAFLRVRLRRLNELQGRRRARAELYLQNLPGHADLALPIPDPKVAHAWHLFVVHHPQRERLQVALGERGIETLLHYPIPPFRQRAFRGFSPKRYPASDRRARECLSLPLYPQLAVADVLRVCRAIKELL